MKYSKLFTGEIITIDEVAYMVTLGIDKNVYDAMNRSQKAKINRCIYNVELRSVQYNPEKFKEYYRCKNIELPPFERVVKS